MKFGIEWDPDRSYSIEEQAKKLKGNGFEATFVNLEDERLEEILAILKKYGIPLCKLSDSKQSLQLLR